MHGRARADVGLGDRVVAAEHDRDRAGRDDLRRRSPRSPRASAPDRPGTTGASPKSTTRSSAKASTLASRCGPGGQLAARIARGAEAGARAVGDEVVGRRADDRHVDALELGRVLRVGQRRRRSAARRSRASRRGRASARAGRSPRESTPSALHGDRLFVGYVVGEALLERQASSSGTGAASRARAWPSRSRRRGTWSSSRARARRREPADPRGYVSRRLGADRGSKVREPLGHRRRLVVDDVEDAGRVALDRSLRRRGDVVDVDERPDPGAPADDGELPLADGLEVDSALRQARARAVEAAVAKGDALEARGLGDALLDVADRLERPRAASGGSGSSGSSSVFTGPPTLAYGQPA